MSFSKKPGRRPLKIRKPSDSMVMRLLEEAYMMHGNPGSKAIARAAGISQTTAWRMFQGKPCQQLAAVEKAFAAMGYGLRLVRVGPSRVSLSEPDP